MIRVKMGRLYGIDSGRNWHNNGKQYPAITIVPRLESQICSADLTTFFY
jgi:hypothetical protein